MTRLLLQYALLQLPLSGLHRNGFPKKKTRSAGFILRHRRPDMTVHSPESSKYKGMNGHGDSRVHRRFQHGGMLGLVKLRRHWQRTDMVNNISIHGCLTSNQRNKETKARGTPAAQTRLQDNERH